MLSGREWLEAIQGRVENAVNRLLIENRNKDGISPPAPEFERTSDGIIVRLVSEEPEKPKRGRKAKAETPEPADDPLQDV